MHALSVDSPHVSESVPFVLLTWTLHAVLRAVRARRAGVVGAAVGAVVGATLGVGAAVSVPGGQMLHVMGQHLPIVAA